MFMLSPSWKPLYKQIIETFRYDVVKKQKIRSWQWFVEIINSLTLVRKDSLWIILEGYAN
jgi:hypothetical protein